MYIDTVEWKMEAYWHDYQNWCVRIYLQILWCVDLSNLRSVSIYHDSSEIQTNTLHSNRNLSFQKQVK